MKNIKYIRLFVYTLLLVAIGTLLGSYLTEKRIEEIQGNTFKTTKIAVINLDEGVSYEGTHRNFAKELISSQKEDIVLTGLDDAKTGMEEGRYSAYVIMPSDFSTNTVTINTEPKKSLIKYEINQNLSDIARDKAVVTVSKIKEGLNNDLGYVYLHSLFNTVHEGQNNSLKVLSNDSKDKEVLAAISNIDLIESLDMSEVKRMENEVQRISVVEDFEKNQELINTIDIAYKGYLGSTMEELGSIQVDSTIVKQNLIQMGMDISNIPTLEGEGYTLDTTESVLNTHNDKLQESKIKINEEANTKKQDSDSVLTNSKNEINGFVDEIDDYNLKIVNFDKFGDIKNDIIDITKNFSLDAIPQFNSYLTLSIAKSKSKHLQIMLDRYILSKLQDYYGKYSNKEAALAQIFMDSTLDANVTSMIKEFSKLYPALTIDTLEKYYQYIFISDSTMTSVYPNEESIIADVKTRIRTDLEEINKPIKEKLEKLDQEFPDYIKTDTIKNDLTLFNSYVLDITVIENMINNIATADKNNIGKAIDKDLFPLKEKQTNHKSDLLKKITIDTQKEETFNERLYIYNPLSFINERQIGGYVREFKQNASTVENKINNKDMESKKFVDESYREANEHVGVIREDINKYQKLSDEKLTNGLEGAKTSRISTSGDNQKLMKDFINTLPYSRLGENANTNAYQFMVEPTISENSVTTTGNNTNKEVDYNKIYIYIIGAAITMLSGLSLYNYIKKRNKDK